MAPRRRQSRIAVEEHDHAYLVTGTSSVDGARKALWEYLGKKKWTKVSRMPVRPLLWKGRPAVAMYFAIGPGAPKKYKP